MYNNYNPYSSFNIKPKFNWGNLLNNTGKTLNVINQAIPIINQVKPILGNAKTLFKVMGAMKDETSGNRNASNPTNDTYNDNNMNDSINDNIQNPKMFI